MNFRNIRILLINLLVLQSILATAQKIPFQGKLLENDELVNATRAFTFSIEARGWTEEHPAVAIVDGYYSVVLGDITPLPNDLFQATDNELMTITVNGESLGGVTIYKPVGTSSAFRNQDSQTTETIAAFEGEVTGTGVWGDENTIYAGVRGIGSALDGGNAGILGEATVSAQSNGFNYGVYGLSNSNDGATNAVGYGVRGSVNGTYSFGVGVRGIGNNSQNPVTPDTPNPNVNNYGGNFTASGNPYGNMGVYGRATDDAQNPAGAINFGVYGEALGSVPENNWAGWFQGRVNVTDEFIAQGNANINGDFSVNANAFVSGEFGTGGNANISQDANISGSINVSGFGNFSAGGNNAVSFGPADISSNDPAIGGNLPFFFMFGDDGGNATIDFRIEDAGLGDYGRIIIGGPGENIFLSGADGIGFFPGDLTTNGTLFSGDGTVQQSDIRLKKDIQPLGNVLAKVTNLRGVSYFWKDESKSTAKKIGFIAQEVEQEFPELVQTADDGYKAVNYAEMTAVLLEAVKALNNKIENLEDHIETLSSANATLQAQFNQLVKNGTRAVEKQAIKAQADQK